jgi:hypothetical protein
VQVCSNCRTTEHVAARSYDLDLPTVLLCDVCSVLLVTDYEMFQDLRGRRGCA